MADSVKVDLQENAPYRVALELAYRIYTAEKEVGTERFNGARTDPRKYFLELYAESRKVVFGMHPDDVIGK